MLMLCVYLGDIDVKITGPGKADIISKEQKDGFVRFVYMPLSPGEYDIAIKNKGRNIHGSPFNSKISGKFYIDLFVLTCIVRLHL